MKAAERALHGMRNDAGYYGPLSRLGMAEYLKFEDFVEMYAFLAYRERPDDVYSRINLEGLRIIAGLSHPLVLLVLKGTVRGRLSGAQGGNDDQSLRQMSRWMGIQPIMCRSRKHSVRVCRSGVVLRLVG